MKSPKVYLRDSGILHHLLGIGSMKNLLCHPKYSASWEGFVIEQVLKKEPNDECFFWATHQWAEIDLVLRIGDRLCGIECKRSDAPRMTRSIKIAQKDLKLERIVILYPGGRRYSLAPGVEAVPLLSLTEEGHLFTS